jgi:uncharacterized protein (DUF1330 family)
MVLYICYNRSESRQKQPTKVGSHLLLPTLDAAANAAFVPKVQAAQQAAGGRNLKTGGGKVVALEGTAPKRVAITEWDSLEKAQAFYTSKAWNDLAPERDKALKTIRRYEQ